MDSKEARKKRAEAMDRKLKKLFPNAKIALNYKTPWELVVAVQLSAQCTDKKVNEVTPALFKKYPTLVAFVEASATKRTEKEFEAMIKPTGFYHNKAKNILAAAKYVKENFAGKLPRTMEDMVKLPGMGRKSANVVLGNIYGVAEGIAVDTHVMRLSRLYGLTDKKDPVKIERDLMEVVPKKDWFGFTYRMIEYGRNYCPARPHDHEHCPLVLALRSYR